jgi:hypothetical protein
MLRQATLERRGCISNVIGVYRRQRQQQGNAKSQLTAAPLLGLVLLGCHMFILCCLVVASTTLRIGRLSHRQLDWVSSHTTRGPLCTYEDLLESFPPKKRLPTADNTRGCSWSLEEEIIRIPLAAIVDRGRVPGGGKLGTVQKAIIRLKQTTHGPTECVAALKTDQCHSASWFFGGSRSCLDSPVQQSGDRSYLGAEYTGALLWYGLQQQRRNQQSQIQISEEGILPTWAIIVQEGSSDVTKRSDNKGIHMRYPHTDPNIVGVVMPLRSFRTVSDILNEDHAGSSWSSTRFASTMLPAARALQFAGHMGLAFRDLIEKNVGVSKGKAFIFDNSYMGVQQPHDCRDISCQYCSEEVFAPFDDSFHREVKRITAGHPYILGDMHNFRKSILRLLAPCPMKNEILEAGDITELVAVLERHVTPE